MRLERPADEQLALRSVLLWLGLSCADDHRYCDDDDQADNYHDHSDDRREDDAGENADCDDDDVIKI